MRPEQLEHPWSAGSCLGETSGDGAGLAFRKITPFSISGGGSQAERETCSCHGKKITFLLTQTRSQSQLCPLEQWLLTSRKRRRKLGKKRKKYMKALESGVQSVSAAAAACQGLGISLPVPKPAPQIAAPCQTPAPQGKLDVLHKTACWQEGCMLRAAHVERGHCQPLSPSSPAPAAQRAGSRGWSRRHRHVRGVCSGPGGSRLAPASSQSGSWKVTRAAGKGQRGQPGRGCPEPGWEQLPRGDVQEPPATLQNELLGVLGVGMEVVGVPGPPALLQSPVASSPTL